MAFKTNHKDELNKLLAPHGLHINMRDVIIKKNSAIINESIRILARRTYEDGKQIPMYIIILSLDTNYDVQWLVKNILDSENIKIIKDELIDEYGLPETKSINAIFDMFT